MLPAAPMKPVAKTMYYILVGLVVSAVLLLGFGVYMASSVLQKKSEEVANARLRSLVVDRNQALLRKAKSDIERYKQLAVVAQSIVPQDKDQTQTVREIANLAIQNGVVLGSVTFPTSTLGDPKATLSQISPAPGIPGVYVLPITIQNDISISSPFANLVGFLNSLEQNRRTALVTGIDLHPDKNRPGNLFFTLTINEYIRP